MNLFLKIAMWGDFFCRRYGLIDFGSGGVSRQQFLNRLLKGSTFREFA